MEDCCKIKKTPRDEELVNNLEKRINRISGQLNGVTKMIKENRYCHDVLIQIAAIESALKEVGFILLKDHMTSCVVDDIKNNDLSSLEEAIELSKKLI
ncbi:MAG: metal-sensing transcriptional repressor [Erysipelotrichaceae bacterium]|nr:metal-sensing transcriptional repressor [Erysipelotrichaceae bacterium]